MQLTPGLPKIFAPGAYAIRLKTKSVRDFQHYMKQHGIQTRQWWAPDQDQHNYYKNFVDNKNNFSRDTSRSCVNLPFYDELTSDDQAHVLECITDFLG